MINNNNGETRCVYRVVNNDIYISSPLKFVITLCSVLKAHVSTGRNRKKFF